MNKTEDIHKQYYNIVGRPAKTHELKNASIHLQKIPFSDEAKSFRDIKHYLTNTSSGDDIVDRLVEEVFEIYSEMLYYQPSAIDISRYKKMLRHNHNNISRTTTQIKKLLMLSDEYRYLTNCMSTFKDATSYEKNDKKIKKGIKYYGPVGTSGYSQVCRDLVDAVHQNISDIQFVPLAFHNASEFTADPSNDLLSSLSKADLIDYDTVIIHSQPELIVPICKKERKKNKNVKIYLITVWETNTIPFMWKLYCSHVDWISTPSEFSSQSFKRESFLPPVSTIHHPVPQIADLRSRTDRSEYRFYNISEWSSRKGVDETLEAFIIAFALRPDADVKFTLKTSGVHDRTEAELYIRNLLEKHKATHLRDKINIIYARLSQKQIEQLHKQGDCYVSLTKAEGHGLGICHAALSGKYVIATNYSGHLDYIINYIPKSNYDLVKFTFEPATFCLPWQKDHLRCKSLPFCQFFDLFVPSQMRWAKADIIRAANFMYLAYVFRKRPVSLPSIKTIETFSKRTVGRKLLADIEKMKKMNHSPEGIPKRIPKLSIFDYEWALQESLSLFNNEKPKILVLNAAGNGNVGDDAYNEVFSSKMSQSNATIYYCKDNCKLLENGQIVPLYHKSENLLHFDHLVLLGGGLLTKERLSKLEYYVELCKKMKANLYIISVGFQGGNIRPDSKGHVSFPDWIQKYNRIFDFAKYISVRSPRDLEIVRMVLKQRNISKTFYYPDVAYAYKPRNQLIRTARPTNTLPIVLIVPTIDVNHETHISFENKIRDLYHSKKYQLVFANFGGFSDTSNSYIISELFQRAKKEYPGSLFLNGKLPTNYTTQTWDYMKTHENYSQNDLDKIFSKVKIVISSRLHGLILGKAFMVPEVLTFNTSNYKIEQEINYHIDLPSNILEKRALEPLKIIEKIISDNITLDYDQWSEDKRNTIICLLSKKMDYSIQYLQSLNNFQLNILLE